MRSSLALLLAPLLVTGCSDRGLDPGDTARLDFALGDLAAGPVQDLSTVDSFIDAACMQVAAWGSDQGLIAFNDDPSSMDGYAWDDYVEGFRSSTNPENGDILYYQFYQPSLMPPIVVPHPLDFTSPNEAIGLVLDYPLDGSGNGTYFVATSGTATVTAIDDTQPGGNVSVHGTNLVLQETDESGEITPNGACVQIGSFDLSATYDNT